MKRKKNETISEGELEPSQNKSIEIDILPIPQVTYCFNILNWMINEIKMWNTKFRKHIIYHSKAVLKSVCVKRKK